MKTILSLSLVYLLTLPSYADILIEPFGGWLPTTLNNSINANIFTDPTHQEGFLYGGKVGYQSKIGSNYFGASFDYLVCDCEILEGTSTTDYGYTDLGLSLFFATNQQSFYLQEGSFKAWISYFARNSTISNLLVSTTAQGEGYSIGFSFKPPKPKANGINPFWIMGFLFHINYSLEYKAVTLNKISGTQTGEITDNSTIFYISLPLIF